MAAQKANTQRPRLISALDFASLVGELERYNFLDIMFNSPIAKED